MISRRLLVLLLTCVLSSSPVFPVYTAEPPVLVLAQVTFDDWSGLQRIRPFGLNVLDVRDTVLLTTVDEHQLADLRGTGLLVRVLDAVAGVGQYYVIKPSDRGLPKLEQPPALWPYVDGLYIARGQAAEVERLIGLGFMLDKLTGGVVLPDTPPQSVVPEVAVAAVDPLIRNLVNLVSSADVQNSICDLQDEDETPGWDALRSRWSYSDELAIERNYIRDKLVSYGLTVRYDSFPLGGRTLQNIEATLPGVGPDADATYIACAHYDSISYPLDDVAPGADDNGSGTASVMEAARVLSRYRFEHTLRFVLFAGEEQGIFGSKDYAAIMRTQGADIRGALNLDMVGWDSDKDGVMEIHAGTRGDSQSLGNAFRSAISAYNLALFPNVYTTGSLTFSDHDSFWDRGYPAILAIERNHGDWNSNYHEPTDTLSNVRMSYVTNFTRAAVATLAKLAGIPPGLRVEHVGPTRVTPGSDMSLTVRYGNTGAISLTGIVLTGTLLGGLSYAGDSSGVAPSQPEANTIVWTLPDLGPNGDRSFSLMVNVPGGLPVGGHVTSTVSGRAASAWDWLADNEDTWDGMAPVATPALPLIMKESP